MCINKFRYINISSRIKAIIILSTSTKIRPPAKNSKQILILGIESMKKKMYYALRIRSMGKKLRQIHGVLFIYTYIYFI